MRIKTTLFTILLLTFSSIVFCQNYNKEIETQFLKYNDLILKKEFNKSMDFVPEKFFEIIPREQMVLLMEKTFNNPEMEFELKGPKNIVIAESKKIEEKFYSMLTYSSLMNMKFNSSEKKEETETEQKLRINLIKLSLQNTFGPDNVKFIESTGFFEVNAQKQAIAISNDGKTDWKFLVFENKQKAILTKLLPKEFTEEIEKNNR
jgi:hypothetical protein